MYVLHCRGRQAERDGSADAELRRGGDRRGTRPERWRRGGSAAPGTAWRSSRTAWSAASARSGRACRPRALLRPYEALAEALRIPGAREALTGSLDVQAVLDRRDEIIHDLDDSEQLPWLEDRGVTLVRGVGVLAGEGRVKVGDEELEATQAVILATGSLPAMPPIEGLDAIDGAWTNREATTAKAIPPRLVIMGGGVVGVEMSQAFQTLGSQVTLIEGERRLLPREEEYACEQLTDALTEYGVDIRTGQAAAKVEERGDTVVVTTADGGTAEGDKLLVALGRVPQTKGLGLESVGLPDDQPVARQRPHAGRRPPVAVRDRRHQQPRAVHPHGQVPGPDRGRPHHGPRHRVLARRRRRPEPARDLHRAAGRRGRPHDRHGARGRPGGRRRRDHDVRQRGRLVLRPRRRPAPAGC